MLVDVPHLFLDLLLAVTVELVDQHLFDLVDLRHLHLDLELSHFEAVGTGKLELFLSNSKWNNCYFLVREK